MYDRFVLKGFYIRKVWICLNLVEINANYEIKGLYLQLDHNLFLFCYGRFEIKFVKNNFLKLICNE